MQIVVVGALLVIVGGVLGYISAIPTLALQSMGTLAVVVIGIYLGVILVRPEVRRSSSGFWIPVICVAGLLCFLIPMWIARSFLS